MESSNCIICAREFETYRYKIQKGLKKTCSKECAAKYRGRQIRKPESEKFNQVSYNRTYYQEHKAEIIEQVRRYRKRTGYKRKLSDEQKAQSNARAMAWYRANKQTVIARSKAWKKANKDKVNAGSRSYASRRRGAVGRYSVEDFIKLKRRFGNMCAYCGKNEANSIDHVTPLSMGGSNYIGNILPVCGYCNSSKGGKNLYRWKVSHERVLAI